MLSVFIYAGRSRWGGEESSTASAAGYDGYQALDIIQICGFEVRHIESMGVGIIRGIME